MITFKNFNILNGSGKSATKHVPLSPIITHVESSGSINVTIDYSTIPQATIIADDNIVDYIVLTTSGYKLYISLRSNCTISPELPLQVKLTLPLFLKQLSLIGSGSIKGSSICEKVQEVDLSGSGDIFIEKLHSNLTSLSLSGSGTIKMLQGVVEKLYITLNGSGNIDVKDATALDCNATMNGSGEIRIKVEKSLAAIVNGSGKIKYICSGVVSQKVNGSGKISKEP